MNKKLIVVIVLFVTVFGVIITGILGAETVNTDIVRAAKIYFEGEEFSDYEAHPGAFQMNIPEFVNEQAVVNLLDYIKIIDADGNPLLDTQIILKFSVEWGNSKYVTIVAGVITFTKPVNAKIKIYEEGGDKKSTAFLYFINNPLETIPVDPGDYMDDED